MHSKDPDKHSGRFLYSQFLLAFKPIHAAARQGTADCTIFLFQHLSLRSTVIDPNCIFENAVFEEDVVFYELDFRPQCILHWCHLSATPLLPVPQPLMATQTLIM